MTETHYSLIELEDYLNEELSAEEAVALERHLEACSSCSASARRLREDSFARGSLTAEAHARAYWKRRLEEGVSQALGPLPGVAQIVGRRGLSALEGVVRVVRGVGRRAGKLRIDDLQSLLPDAAAFPLMPAPEPTAVLTKGSAQGAERFILGTPDGPTAQGELQASAMRIIFAGIPQTGSPPRVVLIPAESESEVRVANPEWKSNRWVIELHGLPPDYLLALLPEQSHEEEQG